MSTRSLGPSEPCPSRKADCSCEEIYWGDNAQKLRLVKAKYDPDNMFANPQSVRLP
jgi:hypothetical protein